MSIILGGNEITGNDQFLLNNTSNNNGNLIVFTNESDDNNNLLINFNSNYDFGFNNNDIILSQHSKHDNYYLKINDSNILFNNINISNIFTSNYIVQDNSCNKIIEIDNNNTYFNNNNVTFNIKEKNFTIKNNNIDIINVSNNILFNCNLYIDTIYCRNINPYDINGSVDVDNFQITSAKTFSNIDLIYTNNDAKLTMISDINKDIYDILVINNDQDNSNIFSINNKGFINYREKSSNSFININNSNNENELYNIINYQGDFATDKFSIDKYSHINIGSNINLNNKGALFTINRNDERKNLDETNSQNVNRDKSLLDLNIFYESSNNYEWFINSNVDSTITELFNNNIFDKDFAANRGSIIMNLDDFNNLFNNYLNKHQSGEKGMYYIDVISSNNIINYNTSNHYYFLTTNSINSEIDYDYTKLKLNDVEYNVSGNQSFILNKRYDENNLLNNSNQVYYEYKVYNWTYNEQNNDNKNFYIIYPAYLKNINNSNLKLECNIENIEYTDNKSAARQLYFSISIDNDKNYDDKDLIDAIDNDNSKKNRLIAGINQFKTTNLVEYISINTDSTGNITLNQTDNISIYCNEYANITLPYVFTIHISREIYNYIKPSNYKIEYNYYYPRVINKPNFINFTNNHNVITTINNNGSLQFGHYDNTTHTDININEYSIISPNNKILTSNIKTDIITSYNNDNISFDNKNIININKLNFSGEGSNLLNVGNIEVKRIISSDSNINIYNSLFDYTINDNNLILSSNKFNNQHYNSIINIDSSYDTDIKPAISISGNEPSYIQKNSNYIYQTIIKNKKFRKNYNYTEFDTKTCYEINYSNLINKNFEYKDDTFNNFNSTHILQHIIDDDIISLGENYNLCFYNGFFTSNSSNSSNSSNYSKLLSQNTYNSSFSMSLGVPYKNENISDYDNGSYYYNYIDYFNSNIRNNNYMLNIFGNTKISGIDGDTNALNVVIHDESNIDGIFFTNIGIGKEPRNETNKNILDVNGDIYTSNIYINDTNISNYLEINVPVIIQKTNINASNINDGIIDLQHIPDIPSSKLEPPSSRPFIYEPNTDYTHPQIGSVSIDSINNARYYQDGDDKYYYNIFESSSNIKIRNSIIADILLIGGGGSANNDNGGLGGDVILLNNIDIINDSTIHFDIGQGGSISGSTISGTETIIRIENNDIKKNITYKAYGGKEGINQSNGNDINPNLAKDIYSYFSVYSSNFGYLSNGERLYFGGNGNGNNSDYLLSLSHGKKGSGGYYSTVDNDKNGINGAIFIRYRFDRTFIETYDTVNDTLGLLQYNWSNNSWSLNYDNFNHCNILLNKITYTSNILNDTINNISNNLIHEIDINSNLLIHETNNISNYIDNINNIIDSNSNYSYENISNLYHINDDIFHTNSNYIIKNEKIPLLNINKLNHVNDYYLYNPIVNNEIVNTTSSYRMINSSNYIFLEHDNSDIAQVTYNIKFQNNDEVDILLVGGGGKGGEGRGSRYHNGGGGGAIIEIKNLRVYTGDTFIIKVGKGGGKNTGMSESLSGQDTTLQYNDYTLNAGGGKGNDGSSTGSGGQFIIPPDFIHSDIEQRNGGNGGDFDAENVAENGFVSDILGSNYYWGGGGGNGMWPIYDLNNSESYGGFGGGGGGAFYLSQIFSGSPFTSQGGKETYFNDTDSDIDNDVTTTNGNNIGIINGAHGINGTGGGGGGSIHIPTEQNYSNVDITGVGGNGGNGIAIIKFKNRYNDNVSVRNAYLYYNYDKTKWEVQSLNSLNLNINTSNINVQQIYYNINNISNYLINYIDTKIIPLPGSNIPLASISGFNIADKSIGPENIFGYMGRASNITDDTDLVEDENGLITIPEEGYKDPENSYYRRLINGSKLQNNSITNDNLVDNTITREKIRGKIHGSKLSNLSIDYNDIIDSINSKVFLTNNLDCNIYFSNFSNISLDLSYFNIDETHINDGYSINITNTTNVEIPINTFSNIRINYSDLNTSCNYDGILNLYSLNNDIDINRFSNININISNLDGYGNYDFIISNINLIGVIPQNYINNIYVNVDNLDSNSLDNANVYLLSNNHIIDNNIIKHFNITYDQLQSDIISNVTITINQDLINNSNIHTSFINISNIDYEINKFSNVSVIFKEGSNINSSNILDSFINIDNIDYDMNKFSNVSVIFKEGSNINSSNIHDSFINIDNIDYDMNKFSNVSVIFKEGSNIDSSNIFNCFIDNYNINYENSLLSNVIINFNVNQTIDAANIYKADINYDNIFFDDLNKLNNITIIFEQNININASNINSSTINSSNIYYDDNNKLSNVIINGDINSSNITNAILNDTTNIIGNNKFEVTVNGQINSSNISRATLENSCTIIGTDTIDNVFINCDIQSSNIGKNAILSQLSRIIGDEKISNITIKGEINANIINNATIILDDDTKFSSDSKIEGPVTITGIIYSSNFDFATYSNQISFDLITGDNTINGDILADESINSTKLASNLDLFVDSITFDDGNMITNLNDYYTSNQINNNFVSKDYHIDALANNIISNSNIDINLYNHSDNTYSNYKAPFILNDNYIFIDSTSNIYTNEDYALLNIYDKNESANIYIYSKNNSLYNYDDINRTSTDNGSMIKFNNPLLSINLQNSNVMEFNINSNISYNDFKLNGNIIFSDNTTIGSGNFNSLYNSYTKQLIMDNTVEGITYDDSAYLNTGEGFIHCNGLHAMFDITAFSTTNSSDKRLKKDIKELSYDNEILKLNPVSFKWNDKNKSNSSNVGFIAQEIEEILPILVKDGPDNYKTVNYIGLIPYLVKHIQNLEERIKLLENK